MAIAEPRGQHTTAGSVRRSGAAAAFRGRGGCGAGPVKPQPNDPLRWNIPDGRPHVTPLIAIWLDDSLYFCTGATERKAKNLARNPHYVITTGCNRLEGLDIVVEGDAVRISHEPTL